MPVFMVSWYLFIGHWDPSFCGSFLAILTLTFALYNVMYIFIIEYIISVFCNERAMLSSAVSIVADRDRRYKNVSLLEGSDMNICRIEHQGVWFKLLYVSLAQWQLEQFRSVYFDSLKSTWGYRYVSLDSLARGNRSVSFGPLSPSEFENIDRNYSSSLDFEEYWILKSNLWTELEESLI